MNVIDIIKARKPKPHARDGILHCRRWKEAQAGLLFDRLIAEMVFDLERELSEPLDDPQFDDMDEEQRRRIREGGP